MNRKEQSERDRRESLFSLLTEKQRRQGYESLYYFAKYIVGFSDMERDPHFRVCQFIQNNLFKGLDILLLLPRGTYKSSIVSVALPLWLWLHDRNLRFLLTSAELSNTKGFVSLIRQNLELNSTFRMLYGHWDENDGAVWHSTALSLAGRTDRKVEASVTASSSDVSKVSQHYDFGFYDDMVTDKNSKTKELRDQTSEYVNLTIPILDPIDGHRNRIFVGTRWDYDDLYGRMLANEAKRRSQGLPKRLVSMVAEARWTENGVTKLFFPKVLSNQFLDNVVRDGTMSRYQASCQFWNKPIADGDATFVLDELGFFRVDKDGGERRQEAHLVEGEEMGDNKGRQKYSPLPKILQFFTVLDPAVGDSYDSCNSAFVTVGVDAEWNIYVWDVRAKQISNDPLIQEMFDVHRTYHPSVFGVEAVAFQKYILWGFRQACRDRNEFFQIRELNPDSQVTKDMRIAGFQYFWRRRKVYLRVQENIDLHMEPEYLAQFLMPGQDKLLDEALHFPRAATKDCIDALAYMPQIIFPGGIPVDKNEPPPGSADAMERMMDRWASKSSSLRTR